MQRKGYINADLIEQMSNHLATEIVIGGSRATNRPNLRDETHKSGYNGFLLNGGMVFQDFVYMPSPAPVSTPSVVYGMFGSNPNPAVSASVLRKLSKSKFSRRSWFSKALKSRLKFDAYFPWSARQKLRWEENTSQVTYVWNAEVIERLLVRIWRLLDHGLRSWRRRRLLGSGGHRVVVVVIVIGVRVGGGVGVGIVIVCGVCCRLVKRVRMLRSNRSRRSGCRWRFCFGGWGRCGIRIGSGGCLL